MVLMAYAVDPVTLRNYVRLTNRRKMPEEELPEIELPDNIKIGPTDNLGSIRQKAMRALITFLSSEPKLIEEGRYVWIETALLPIIALNDTNYQMALRHFAEQVQKLNISAVRGYWFKPSEWQGTRHWIPPYWFTDWSATLIHGCFEEGYHEWEVRSLKGQKRKETNSTEECSNITNAHKNTD